MEYQLAPNTISQIYFQLGDAKKYALGERRTGSVRGQIVKPTDWGENHIPKIIDYQAEVVMEGEELEWKIINFKVI